MRKTKSNRITVRVVEIDKRRTAVASYRKRGKIVADFDLSSAIRGAIRERPIAWRVFEAQACFDGVADLKNPPKPRLPKPKAKK